MKLQENHILKSQLSDLKFLDEREKNVFIFYLEGLSFLFFRRFHKKYFRNWSSSFNSSLCFFGRKIKN